jgi:polyvinyl alcohol dehydrogenase (cytochrome)
MTAIEERPAPPRRRRWRRPVAVAAGAALVVAAAACGEDASEAGGEPSTSEAPPQEAPGWRSMGNGPDNTRAAEGEDTVSPDNVATLEPAWTLDGLQGLSGTPVIVDGTVYLGDWSGHIRAVDAESGEELWATDAGHGLIAQSVAVTEDRVVAAGFESHMVAVDRESGELLWETQVDDQPASIVFGGAVEVDGLVVLGIATMDELTPGAPPSLGGSIVALDAESGEEAWRYWIGQEGQAGSGGSVWSSAAFDEDRGHIYIGTANNTTDAGTTGRTDAVVSLDAATGEEVWVSQFTPADTMSTGDVGAPPNLFEVDGADALGVGDKGGVYRALDRETGEVLWETSVTDGGPQGGIMGAAAVAGDSIYVASNKASADADLVALDRETGEEQWRIDVGGHVSGPVTWANDVVYVGDSNGRFLGYSAADGSLLWESEPVPDKASGGIAVVDGTVYGGYGWWAVEPPPDPQGGLVAFRPSGAAAEGADR